MWYAYLIIPKYIVPPNPALVETLEKFWNFTSDFVAPRIWWKTFCVTLLTWPNQVSNIFGVVRVPKIYKKWTSNSGENWGWCCKKWLKHSFVSDNVLEVRIQSACLYQKLMCSFSIPLSFSFSYVLYYASIYPIPKLCTASAALW